MVGDILHRMAREGNFDKATPKQRSGWSEGRHRVDIKGDQFQEGECTRAKGVRPT